MLRVTHNRTMLVDVTKVKQGKGREVLIIDTPYGPITRPQGVKLTPPAVYFMTKLTDYGSDYQEDLVQMYDGKWLIAWAMPHNSRKDKRYEELSLKWYQRMLDYYGESEIEPLNLYYIRLNAARPKATFVR